MGDECFAIPQSLHTKSSVKSTNKENEQTGEESKTENTYQKILNPELQYKEPEWSGSPAYPYTLEVLKSGQILEELDVSSACFVTIGRLPSCDVTCAHPSISRYHAVLQHRPRKGEEKGCMFLFDLGGSYGTTVNKVKIKPKTYYMLKTGYVIKFGASTRLYIVKGPPEEAFEDEEEMTVQDNSVAAKLGIVASEEAEIMEEMLRTRNQEVAPKTESSGINWGFKEDASEELNGELQIDLNKMNNPAEFKDPKKTMRGFFEREGVELEFDVTERRSGRSHEYVCKVELPIDTPSPVFAEGVSSGKKRDAILACCLHGCKLLDAYGVLRSVNRLEPSETKAMKLAENDYYSSDEDSFFDRTGDLDKKRRKRMKRAGVKDST